MTDKFWKRYVSFAGITNDKLDIYFKIKGGKVDEPATCAVTIYNLAPDTIKKFKKKDIGELEAGYENNHQCIFTGQIADVETEREGNDIATHIHLTDAECYKLNRKIGIVNIAKNTPIIDALKLILNLFDIPIGKADNYTKKYEEKPTISPDRRAKDLIDTLVGELNEEEGGEGCEFFMRNGGAYIVKKATQDTEKVKLSSGASGEENTGLLEVEPIEKKEKGEGEKEDESIADYKVKSLLIPQLRHWTTIELKNDIASGNFKVVSFGHHCTETEYYTIAEVKAL